MADLKTPTQLQKAALAAMRRGTPAWNTFIVEYKNAGHTTLDLTSLDFTGISFNDLQFPITVEFDGSNFDSGLVRGHFATDVFFRNCVFHRPVRFETYHVGNSISFEGTTFEDVVEIQTIHNARIDFTSAEFKAHLQCIVHVDEHPDRWRELTLNLAVCRGQVVFGGCKFKRVECRQTKFCEAVNFRNSSFGQGADFSDAIFYKSVSFENVIFSGSSSYSRTLFETAPNFHNSELHQGTLFSPSHEFPRYFPDTTSTGSAEAYRTLKLAMNKEHALSEEAGFFLLEMRARARTEPFVRRNLYRTYDLLSKYGQSIKLPFLWFIIVNFGFGAIYSLLSGQRWETVDPQLSALTLFGAVPFAPALKWPEITGGSGAPFPPDKLVFAQIAIALQSVFSGVLLYLIGLGLRNMFKIR